MLFLELLMSLELLQKEAQKEPGNTSNEGLKS
jgi:hypothetical protein